MGEVVSASVSELVEQGMLEYGATTIEQKDLNDERWKLIVEFPNYEVSDLGRIRRVNSNTCAVAGHILRIAVHKKTGYCYVCLFRERKAYFKTVHSIVLETFLSKRVQNMQVNHRDGSKVNNRLANLEWVTRSENQKHAYKTGLQKPTSMKGKVGPKGERNGQAKLTEQRVKYVRLLLRQRVPQTEVAARVGVTQSVISNIKCGKIWTHVE